MTGSDSVFRMHTIFKKRVSRLQNGESSIVLVAKKFEVLVHSVDGDLGYADPVHESNDKQWAEDGNDSDINLPGQRRLVDA